MDSNRPITILNVDDNHGHRYTIGRIFKRAGFHVIEADTGSKALRLVLEGPDLILLDVNLPDMSGYEVCKKIRENPLTASLPIMHVSATHISASSQVQGLEGGADAYLTHPVDPEVLTATARALIRMRQAEQRARQSEVEFRLLAEDIPQIVWTNDPEGKLEFLNQHFWKYTGLAPEEDIFTQIRLSIHPEFREIFDQVWGDALKRGSIYEMELPLNLANGHYRWFLARAIPIRNEDNKITKWVGTATDIDDQKRGENTQRLLAEAGEILISSLDQVSILRKLAKLSLSYFADCCLVDLIDENGSIDRIAVACAKEEEKPLIHKFKNHFPWPYSPSLLEEVMREGVPKLVLNWPCYLNLDPSFDPQARESFHALNYTSFLIVPLKGHQSVLGTITFILAGSERQYFKRDIDVAMDLANRVVLAIDNAKLYQEAQRAISSREDLLAFVSHDLKNPVGTIELGATLLKESLSEIENPEQRKFFFKHLDTIHHLTGKMKHLIDDLLDITKIEGGSFSIYPKDIYIQDLFQNLLENFSSLANKKDIILETFIHPSASPFCKADPGNLERAITNILDNAIKFTPPQGFIRLHVEKQQSALLFGIEDSGPGIPEDQIEHIFDRFWQAKKTAKMGTGLGLAITKGIVEAHGGEIWVESQSGKGSFFYFTIPQ